MTQINDSIFCSKFDKTRKNIERFCIRLENDVPTKFCGELDSSWRFNEILGYKNSLQYISLRSFRLHNFYSILSSNKFVRLKYCSFSQREPGRIIFDTIHVKNDSITYLKLKGYFFRATFVLDAKNLKYFSIIGRDSIGINSPKIVNMSKNIPKMYFINLRNPRFDIEVNRKIDSLENIYSDKNLESEGMGVYSVTE